MKKVEAFETSDGKIFKDEQGAKQHEHFLAHREEVGKFLHSDMNLYKSLPQMSIAETTIIRWELYKTENLNVK